MLYEVITVPSDPAKGGNGVYASYIDVLPNIQNDSSWSYLLNKYNTSWNPTTQKWENGAPEFTYHRFWAQVDMATAYAEYDRFVITSYSIHYTKLYEMLLDRSKAI